MMGTKGQAISRKPALLVVVALLVLAGWRLAEEVQPPAGSWVRVERRDLVIGVELEGELRAVESTTIGPPQIRRLWQLKLSMLVPEGSKVKKGQPIAGFDTTQLQQRLRDEMTERDAAEKELEKKTTDLEIERRQSELALAEARARYRLANLKLTAPVEVVRQVEVEKALIDQRLAQLEIESGERRLEHLSERGRANLAYLREKRDFAATQVERLQENMQQMTVKAPRAGTLIHLPDWRGNKVKEGDSVWRARKILEIPNLDRMQGDGVVDEADAGRIAVGQPVVLRLDAYPGRQYRGRVESIRRAVQSKSPHTSEKVVKVVIEVEETDRERMRPGMRFRGEIEVQRVVQTLVLPQETVRLDANGPRVTVQSFWGSRQVVPAFGARNAHSFEIVSGLREGDQVLHHGMIPEEGS